MKFGEPVLDGHGPAQIGFSRRSNLTVYDEKWLSPFRDCARESCGSRTSSAAT